MANPRVGDEFFTHCPRKHKLPNRQKHGRCTPDECCIAGDGAHKAVKEAHALRGYDKARVQAYAEETEHLLDAKGRMAAWDDQHPLPKLATLPEFKPGSSVFQYLRERTAQAAPLALERIIRKALLVPGPAGDAAADNILDRMGFTRKGDAPVEFSGPVNIVNLDPSRIPLLAQKPREQVIEGTPHQLEASRDEEVRSETTRENDLVGPGVDDTPGVGDRVHEGDEPAEGGDSQRERRAASE